MVNNADTQKNYRDLSVLPTSALEALHDIDDKELLATVDEILFSGFVKQNIIIINF